MNIADHIFQFQAINARLSPLKELKSFFEDIPLEAEKDWPLCLSKDKTEYIRAEVLPDRFGLQKELYVDVICHKGTSRYVISQQMFYDGSFSAEIISILREGKNTDQYRGFAHELIDKYAHFLNQFVKTSHGDVNETYLKIQAHSGILNGIQTNGGYIWATCRFDFDNEDELKQARQSFQQYALEHGCQIETSDLRFFKYPCHFAAFRSDQKVNGYDIGKAFLLQYNWRGRIRAGLKKSSELVRYEKAFYEKGKMAAEKELSIGFLKMMKKYNTQFRAQKNILSLFKQSKNKQQR